MKLIIVLKAIRQSSIYGSYGPPQQRDRESRRLRYFFGHLLRREEKQVAEIARLQKQLSTERSILDNAPVWAELANCPPETVIGIRYGTIIELHAEIARLKAQVAALETENEQIVSLAGVINER